MSLKPILIVEDDELIRENLRDILEMEGYVVMTAENGRVGLDRIREFKGQCVVLLDLQMPVMTGEELLEELHAEVDPALKATPVVVITARGTPLPELNVPLLRKPIDLEELLQTLKNKA